MCEQVPGGWLKVGPGGVYQSNLANWTWFYEH